MRVPWESGNTTLSTEPGITAELAGSTMPLASRRLGVPMRRLRLRTLLVLLVLVTTVPIALLAAWLISRSSAQQEALIDRQNIEQARAIIVGVDQEIEDVISSLNVLSLLEPNEAPDKTHFAEIAARVLPTHRNWQSI